MEIRKCLQCNAYTLEDICKRCGAETKGFRNYKFILKEKYVLYRIKEKYGLGE